MVERELLQDMISCLEAPRYCMGDDAHTNILPFTKLAAQNVYLNQRQPLPLVPSASFADPYPSIEDYRIEQH